MIFKLVSVLLILSSLAFADSSPKDFRLVSSAFVNNALIPKRYTCDGDNINPPLMFKNIPFGTISLSLTVSDPDAPNGRWSHWVVYNIPTITKEIDEDSTPGAEGVNDFGKDAYGGPCPPPRKAHHYMFQAYALDEILIISNKPTIIDIEKAVKNHILAQAQLVGTYQK